MYSIIDTVCYVRLQTPEDMPIGEIGKVVADEDRLFATTFPISPMGMS